MARLLTQNEIDGFKRRHLLNWLLWSPFIPAEGRFVQDELGWILVFKKEDGAMLYIATDLNYDPTTLDPDRYWYIISETLKAVGENAKRVAAAITPAFNMALLVALLAAIVLALFFMGRYAPQRKN